MINKIKFEIFSANSFYHAGMYFESGCFVRPVVDGVDLIDGEFDNEDFAVLSEWIKASRCTGYYVLFTSVAGVSDEGGWGWCKVVHFGGNIIISTDEVRDKYMFDADEFRLAVNFIEEQVGRVTNAGYCLLPKYFVPPESPPDEDSFL